MSAGADDAGHSAEQGVTERAGGERGGGEHPSPAHTGHLVKEGLTMALYVAVCLLAALVALVDHSGEEATRTLGVIWGTTVGLVLAHLFAFRVSARLIGRGTVQRDDLETAGTQLAGGVAVAVLASVPVVLLPASAELDAVLYVLAAFIAAVAYAVARRAGARPALALAYVASVVLVAGLVVAVKNGLVGH